MLRSSAKNLSDRSLLLVFLCTLIGAAAQVLFKLGSAAMGGGPPAVVIVRVLTNPALLLGFVCYGVNTLLLVLALRKGELSLTYPVISLTYVWVTILSVLIFREQANLYKIVGLSIIMSGVAVLGRAGRS